MSCEFLNFFMDDVLFELSDGGRCELILESGLDEHARLDDRFLLL